MQLRPTALEGQKTQIREEEQGRKSWKEKENLIWSWEVGGWKENKAYN